MLARAHQLHILCLLFVALALGLSSLSVYGAELDTLTSTLLAEKKNLSVVEQDIKRCDLEIAQIIQNIAQINHAVKRNDQKIAALKTQKQEKTQTLYTEQTRLFEQLQIAYRLSKAIRLAPPGLSDTLHQTQRTLNYMHYLSQHQDERIEKIKRVLEEIDHINKQLLAISETQLQKKKEILATQAQFQTLHKKNETLRTQLVKSIETKEYAIAQYQKKQKTLSRIVSHLALSPQDNIQNSKGLRFSTLKGKLPWPTAGHIASVQTPESTTVSAKKERGIFISAPEGTPIKPVYYGQVIFADWLKGFGLLMIVDHGDGYMSLYGHNQVLYKNIGDRVDPNEPISLVGKSGGNQNSGLYFEIRHNGSPISAATWIASR
jgi:septal ring factor EnvC (AmiA/AmiB activator)